MDDAASNRPASPRRDLRLLLPSAARWHEFRETLAALLAPAPVRIASQPETPIANPRAQACSLALHAGMIALLLIPAYYNGGDPPGIKPPGGPGWMILPGDWQKEITPQPPKGGGTGGERNPIPHTRGMLPRFDRWQITPPRVDIPERAQLQVEATLVGWPEMQPPNIAAPNFGDPTRQLFTLSPGPGERGGMGDKCCGAVSDGERGPGFGPGWDGNWGGETPRAGRSGTTYPVCMHCPNRSSPTRRARPSIRASCAWPWSWTKVDAPPRFA
jgi:hypothetical protein